MHPDIVAQMVINSIREDRLYIITHPDFLQFAEMKLKAIQHDALALDSAMRNKGLVHDANKMNTFNHPDIGFSISYPANWVEQNPTPLMNFDFMAVSDTVFPGIIIRVLDAPKGKLDESMDMSAKIISQSLGMGTKVVSKTATLLRDGTPAVEGEIEIHLPNGNQLIYLGLNAIKGEKLINIILTSVKLRYDKNMKKRLQSIAYTLHLN